MAKYIDVDKIFPNGVFYVNTSDPYSSLTELINRIHNSIETIPEIPAAEELNPCTFCGGEAKFINFVDMNSRRPACMVRCNGCGTRTRDFISEDQTFSYKDEAAKQWNTRTQQKESAT